jgi:hypothetical protein
VKQTGSLATKMNSAKNGVITIEMLGLSGEGDRFFNEWPQLFSLRNGSDNVLLFGIDQRSREIAKH